MQILNLVIRCQGFCSNLLLLGYSAGGCTVIMIDCRCSLDTQAFVLLLASLMLVYDDVAGPTAGVVGSSCVTFRSFNASLSASHSINGFRTPPTIAIPRAASPFGSFARTMWLAGNIGLSGATCAASFAACSMASISSLQPAWSNGHTTIGCRKRMSLADDICACNSVSEPPNPTPDVNIP